jgi:hypothetical protein
VRRDTSALFAEGFFRNLDQDFLSFAQQIGNQWTAGLAIGARLFGSRGRPPAIAAVTTFSTTFTTPTGAAGTTTPPPLRRAMRHKRLVGLVADARTGVWLV